MAKEVNSTVSKNIYYSPNGRGERPADRVVIEVVQRELNEDDEDLEAFQSRAQEPNLDFDNVARSLRRRGRL